MRKIGVIEPRVASRVAGDCPWRSALSAGLLIRVTLRDAGRRYYRAVACFAAPISGRMRYALLPGRLLGGSDGICRDAGPPGAALR